MVKRIIEATRSGAVKLFVAKTAAKTVLAAALASSALVALPATPAMAQTAQTARVDSIQIEGAQRIEEETIRSYLDIREGQTVSASQINQAFRRLVATGLFQDVRITPRSNGVLSVVVVENPVINAVAFEGNRNIEDEILAAQVRSRPRGAYTMARAEADAQTIIDAYRAAGRYSAQVTPKIIDRGENRVDLVFEIIEGDEVNVSAINFVGNGEYSDRRLRQVVQTTEAAWWKIFTSDDNYDADRLEFDKELLRRFYFSRGYADFEVLSAVADLSPERDGFFITFTVSEGEQYSNGEVSVVSEMAGVDAAAFEDLVETDPGDTYDADLVQRTIKQMQEFAARQGVNFLEVRPSANKRRGENGEPIIDIAYTLVEGPRVYVERIEIEGNSRTLDRVIRREFTLSEGDAFNAYRLQESRDRVRALGYFSRVDVKPERGSAEDRVVVRTEVTEQSTGDISFGIGFSTGESVGGEVSITERNFLGRGQFVRASVQATADKQLYDFRFTEPYFLDRNLRAGFDIYHQEIDNQDQSAFDVRRTGFRPRIGFAIDENSSLDFNYLIENDEIRGVPSDASPLVKADQGSQLVSSFGVDYALDFRNSRATPTEGFIFRLGQDVAGLGGDAFYSKTEASVKGYTSFFREEVVASLEFRSGALVGLKSDDVRINDRFFLGGDSFRGFEGSGIGPRDNNAICYDAAQSSCTSLDDALGGNYYLMARADLSFPLGLPDEYGIYGGLFMDAGTVWGLEDSSYSAFNFNTGAAQTFTVDDGLNLRVAAGASLFWTSPFGPIRLNFAHALVKEDTDNTEFFRLTAGTRF